MAGRWVFSLHKPSVAYAATSMASTMMHSVFMFYYVKVYLNRFHTSEWWFQVAQVIFMIWNAINDPLFGYIQDNMTCFWVKSRRHSILYGAPLFALSFILPWFPWGSYISEGWLSGVQLLIVLCFYDALFTFVLLAQCALFAEMSQNIEDRLRLVRYSQIASLLGSPTVFFCGLISNNLENYPAFLMTCVVIATLSLGCMVYSGKNAFTEYDLQLLHNTASSGKSNKSDELFLDKSSEFSVWQQTRQIFSQQSFVSFVLMNFCQILHITFDTNFLGIICDQIIPKEFLPSTLRSIFYGLVFVVPAITVIFGTPIVRRFGYYRVIQCHFFMKMAVGIMMYILGYHHYYFLMFFFLIESAGNNATFSLFNLCLSDIVDHDIEEFQRRHPLSSMVFGTNALVTKPAISFAPMIAVAILNQHGYEQVKAATPLPSIVQADLNATMFLLACATPVVIGLLQLLIWSRYTIRDSHLTVSKYTET